MLSLESAPRSKLVVSGRKGDILDLGFARITNKWAFKLKEYQASIGTIDDGTGRLSSGCALKFSPAVRFGVMAPIIQVAAARIRFTWMQMGVKYLEVDILGGINLKRKSIYAEIAISLVQW